MEKETTQLNKKLDKILENQEKILGEEKEILEKEKILEEMEEKDLKRDKDIMKSEKEALQELEKLEQKLKERTQSPLKSVTKKDVAKGVVGAFVGVVGHYAFLKGKEFAQSLNFWNATILYLVSIAMLIIILYYTGFRTVERKTLIKFLPTRVLILYLTAIFTILVIYLFFGILKFSLSFIELYKLVGANIVLATLGAGTADLIGRGD